MTSNAQFSVSASNRNAVLARVVASRSFFGSALANSHGHLGFSGWFRRNCGGVRRRLPLLQGPVVLSLAALLMVPLATADDGWRYGRATFYGGVGGGSIDDGSCMYGALPNSMVSTGTDIAALSDQDDHFAGSCGRCYEVQCNPAAFSDGYGDYLDRNHACYDSSKTITITITDSCPCNYPANAYSNRRWCCGDMYHMDLSNQAFEKLADIGLGVIGVRFRQVDCPGGFQPSPREATQDFPAGTRKRRG